MTPSRTVVAASLALAAALNACTSSYDVLKPLAGEQNAVIRMTAAPGFDPKAKAFVTARDRALADYRAFVSEVDSITPSAR